MHSNSVQMIELLSLRREQSAFMLGVGIGQVRSDLEIDEFTYNQLSELHPFAHGRVRLSLYSKWDPFRKIHYSTLVRMNGAISETLYFHCTELYLGQLRQLKSQAEALGAEPAPVVPALAAEAVPAAEIRPDCSRKAVFNKRTARFVIRTIAASVLLFVAMLHVDNGMLLSPSPDANRFANAAGSIGTENSSEASLEKDEAEKPADPSAQPAAAPPDTGAVVRAKAYERMSIGNERGQAGLPKGYVALSFDDGPSGLTQKIVDILFEHQVAATFLFVGQNALKHPEAVIYAKEHDMAIGSHSWDHSDLRKASRRDQQANLVKANQALESLTGFPVTVFRPPYGSQDRTLQETVQDQKMKMLLWNRDPEDWKAKTKEDILRYLYDVSPSGGIYVMHEDKLTVEALPDIIEYLQNQGLTFVTFE